MLAPTTRILRKVAAGSGLHNKAHRRLRNGGRRDLRIQSGGALPIELENPTLGRLEINLTRTRAARSEQLGVCADGQAERTVLFSNA
jgi:hypothetical protein